MILFHGCSDVVAGCSGSQLLDTPREQHAICAEMLPPSADISAGMSLSLFPGTTITHLNRADIKDEGEKRQHGYDNNESKDDS